MLIRKEHLQCFFLFEGNIMGVSPSTCGSRYIFKIGKVVRMTYLKFLFNFFFRFCDRHH